MANLDDQQKFWAETKRTACFSGVGKVVAVVLFLLVAAACRPEREPEEPEKGPELPRPQTPAD
jgi:hypothetical protein